MSGNWQDLADMELVRFGVPARDVHRIVWGQVYLATPYSKLVRVSGRFVAERSRGLADAAAELQMDLAVRGVTAVSPIAQAHHMLMLGACPEHRGKVALDADFWTRWCEPMLDASAWVYVPDLPGWRESDGIWREVAHALRRNKPVLIGGRL